MRSIAATGIGQGRAGQRLAADVLDGQQGPAAGGDQAPRVHGEAQAPDVGGRSVQLALQIGQHAVGPVALVVQLDARLAALDQLQGPDGNPRAFQELAGPHVGEAESAPSSTRLARAPASARAGRGPRHPQSSGSQSMPLASSESAAMASLPSGVIPSQRPASATVLRQARPWGGQAFEASAIPAQNPGKESRHVGFTSSARPWLRRWRSPCLRRPWPRSRPR